MGVKTNYFIPLLGLLCLAGCSTIEQGLIVKKGHSENSVVSPPIDYYWVDVRGKNRAGKEVTERVQLFKPDWDRYKKGDRISPHNYDMIGATKAIGTSVSTSVKKITTLGAKPTPVPATPQTAKPRVSTQKKRPQPARAATPKTAAATPKPVAATPKTAATTPKPVESEAAKAARFRSAETRAHEDPAIRELKRNIHNARSDEEQTAAFQEHRRALFQKMRELEPSLKDRIDQAEGAAGR